MKLLGLFMSDFLSLVQVRLEELLKLAGTGMFLEEVRKAKHVCDVVGILEKSFDVQSSSKWYTADMWEHVVKQGQVGNAQGSTIQPFCYITGLVWIGEGCEILAGTCINGPVYIGDKSIIGPQAIIRPKTIIGSDCHVGDSEIKNSIILNHSNAPHKNYVGDSIIGEHCNLGSGTQISNVLLSEKNIRCKTPTELYETKRKKFGAIIEDYCKTGCNVVLNPGKYMEEGTEVFIVKTSYEERKR